MGTAGDAGPPEQGEQAFRLYCLALLQVSSDHGQVQDCEGPVHASMRISSVRDRGHALDAGQDKLCDLDAEQLTLCGCGCDGAYPLVGNICMCTERLQKCLSNPRESGGINRRTVFY